MQHKDRRQFVARIIQSVEEICGIAPDAEARQRLHARIDDLLDDFLLERQAIVGTDATVLLADIRGFTALTQSLPAETIITMLNEFFSMMCDIIERYGGAVDKFMGDSVMAVFGVPERKPDDLPRALACAVEMQQGMLRLNELHQSRGRPSLFVGIAISTGRVMAGSFGSRVHSEYTVIGDAVNLAARMESFSLRGQVLLSEATRSAAGDCIEIGGVNQVRVKGMSQPLSLYELRAMKGEQPMPVPRVEMRRSPRIAVTLDAMFRQIEAKRVAAEQFVGRVSDIGYFGMSADLPVGLPAYAEVVINLAPDLGLDPAPDIYARVLRTRPIGQGFRTSMEFTAIGTPGHSQVKEFVDSVLWRR
jgi:adenylate cyclase